MKNILVALILLSSTAHASSRLACWSKGSSSRFPVIVANITGADTLSNLVDNDVKIDEVLVGKINPKATKYKGYYYFEYNIESTQIETILPPNFSQETGYFDAVSRGTAPDGGATTKLRCRVNR